MARRGVLAAAVIVRPPRHFPDRDVVAIGGRRCGRRPDASVGRSPGSSSGATRRGRRRDGADNNINIDIDINIDINIDFQLTNRGDGGILLPRRGRRRTRRRREVAGAGLTRRSVLCRARRRGPRPRRDDPSARPHRCFWGPVDGGGGRCHVIVRRSTPCQLLVSTMPSCTRLDTSKAYG
jgi:hypothetical protein